MRTRYFVSSPQILGTEPGTYLLLIESIFIAEGVNEIALYFFPLYYQNIKADQCNFFLFLFRVELITIHWWKKLNSKMT